MRLQSGTETLKQPVFPKWHATEKTDPDQAQTSSSKSEMLGGDGGTRDFPRGNGQPSPTRNPGAKMEGCPLPRPSSNCGRQEFLPTDEALGGGSGIEALGDGGEEKRLERMQSTWKQRREAKRLEVEMELKHLELERAKLGQPGSPNSPPPGTAPHSKKFPTYKVDDDTEAFLEKFERSCFGYNIPTDQYTVELRPQLSGLLAEMAAEIPKEHMNDFRNAKTFVKISQGMKDRGHNRDPKQCRVKLKELRQAYQKTREANGRSGSEPQTCRFYDELHAILGGSATTTPAVLFDSFNGDGGNMEAGFGDEEDDDDDEVVDSSQQASGETGFPDSQELFLTLDLEPVPPEPTQGCLLDPAGGEGTSAACVSMITGSSPSQRLVKIRKKKKRTQDEMFSELMLSSHTDRAQTHAWRQIMSDCRKAQNDQEERWRAEESKWRAEESKWRAEERAEARMWRQRDERRQDSMLRLLEDQTSMLQCMVELQQRQLEHRLPLQPLCNQPPSSPSSIASTPRRPRTRWGGHRPTSHSTTEDCPKKRRLSFNKF
ncbi:uncharacterized protein LOC141981919 [Natator depressus]|uniref:uncharacterized protein LOC141981919 n=1 Tax=Natator depressus TaxID=27790 RepID=UPI003EB962F3